MTAEEQEAKQWDDLILKMDDMNVDDAKMVRARNNGCGSNQNNGHNKGNNGNYGSGNGGGRNSNNGNNNGNNNGGGKNGNNGNYGNNGGFNRGILNNQSNHHVGRQPLIIERYRQLDFTGIVGYPNQITNDLRLEIPKFSGNGVDSAEQHGNGIEAFLTDVFAASKNL
ncbi:trihydrophobin-like [Cryptomeria japonica]|uniref:trihydrophobin-like n=1 Tax=Cryptomeria japonica TaxID=3369 RepID=UPI0027DA3B3E|nr:trihydrophobin-like [Cryptomeria japonica]